MGFSWVHEIIAAVKGLALRRGASVGRCFGFSKHIRGLQ